jgi:hypothetical protein
MSGRGRAIRVVLRMGLLGLTTLAVARAAAPAASAAELARCAAITAADERLACYDALVCAGIAAADERLACYDALAKPKTRPQAAPADAARPEGGGNDVKNFGVVRRRLAPPEGPELIKALVTKVSVDRLGNVDMSLDNGQSWTFHDPDVLLRSGDAVTIRRAALGSFLMTTPRRHTYRVQRTQ